MEKKMTLDDAMLIIAMDLEEVDYYGDFEQRDKSVKAWKRIREVIKNSEEYKKERESK